MKMFRYVWIILIIANCVPTTLAFHGNPCCIPQRREPIICYGPDCLTYTSQTFMFTHPLNQNLALLKSLWHSMIYSDKPDVGAFQCIGVFQGSQNYPKAVPYFLFDKKEELVVTGDHYPGARLRDVRAEWLGIQDADFYGLMSVLPEQKQFGFFLELFQPLSSYCSISLLKDWWVTVRMPFVMVENNLNLRQYGIMTSPADHGPKDIIQAFNQPAWKYAKMSPVSKSAGGLAEINILVGSTLVADDYNELAYYSGISIGTSSIQDPAYLFSPFVGNNGHSSIEGGLNIQFPLNCDTTCGAICFIINAEVHYMIHNQQCRTFDLRGKQWSRYLQFNEIDGPPDQNIPGVNILTRLCKVRPYVFMEIVLGWRYITDRVEAEVGCNLWGHGTEKIRFVCPFPENKYGIAGNGAIAGDPSRGASASKSTIGERAPNDDTFIAIRGSDIDLLSAENRSGINYKVYGSVGYTYHGEHYDGFLGIGGFYEFVQYNNSLQFGGLWAKFGASI